MVSELITRLDGWLSVHRPNYYAQLQRGVESARLDAFEETFSLQLPAAFRDLYKWRNGQRPTYFQSLQMNWMFSPLEDVAGSKQILDGMIGSDFESPDWWRVKWVPFLANGGGDHVVIDLLGSDVVKPKAVLTFWHDEPDRPVRFPSLEHFDFHSCALN